MIRFKETKGLESRLARELKGLMEAAAAGAADGLAKRLSYRSGKRTGRKYAKYKRRSSAWGEYPQQQSGELHSSVTSIPGSRMQALVGIQAQNDPEKLPYLENEGGNGMRKPVFMFFEGKDSERTLKLMSKAIKREIGSR